MTRLLLPLFLGMALSVSADSFLYVSNGQAITNGTPVNVKALKARYAGAGSFFWFSIDGKSYIARDPNVLRRVKDVYRPVFETGADFTVGEQLGLFAKRANASAARLNDYNARLPEINRRSKSNFAQSACGSSSRGSRSRRSSGRVDSIVTG